jgi:lipoprotein-anchoring transpeptidase ErfK/SrfK
MKTNGGGTRFRKVSRATSQAASTVEAAVPAAQKDLAGDTPAATARNYSAIRPCLLLLALFVASCAVPDTRHQIVISAREQKLALLDRGSLMAIYPVSTSKFGLGDRPGSSFTPLGELEVAKKIGDNAPVGAVFKDRRRTGEIVAIDSPGRDPIVTRILWLRGRESHNANAYARTIYIHGTPEERNIGLPVSYGCIRMRSSDIINLYNIVGWGTKVTIIDAPLAAAIPTLAPRTQLAATNESTTNTIH